MPIGTRNPTFITQDVVDELAQEKSWPRRHPDWPEYLWPVDKVPRDIVDDIFANRGMKFDFDVFATATCKRIGRRRELIEHEAENSGTAEHRGALARSGNAVYQLWDGPKTRQRFSVLGRIGSITVIRERIKETLLRKHDIQRKQLTTAELARFVCTEGLAQIKSTAKLLDRVNHGCFVNERNLARVCSSLRLVVEDVAFVHPTIFAGANTDRGSAYNETRRQFPPQLPAMRWIGSELELYELIAGQKGQFKLDVKVFGGPMVQLLGSKIRFIIEICGRQSREHALPRLIQLSRDLASADLAAWVSYIAGSGDGDPDGRARFIITIDNEETEHNFIKL